MADVWTNKVKNEKKLGILGGMGSYATVYAFKKILDKIDAKKEWDYPRIIIDNNPKLPSRVRAILYNEHKEEIIDGMCDSIKKLTEYGADMIFIPCNTAHYFIEDIKDELPSINIFNIIAAVGEKCKEKNYQRIGVLASEGAIVTDTYRKYIKNKDLNILYPPENKFKNIREIIEDVKQNKISEKTKITLESEINRFNNPDCVIIGCTEFSVVWELLNKNRKRKCKYQVFDALNIAIDKIVLWLNDKASGGT